MPRLIQSPSGPVNPTRSLHLLVLFFIIIAGFTLRVWDINFDQGMGSHPDERSTACNYAPSIQLPKSWDEFWDPQRSTLNPLWDIGNQQRRSFTYGHFPLYLGVAMGQVMHWLAPTAEWLGVTPTTVTLMAQADGACGPVAVAGRLVIALLDTLTIGLLFLLGRRIYSPGAGLVAATLYAVTAQAIQLSHFFAMDPASTTFTVLAVLGGVMMVQERSWRAALLTGVAAGLAISSKFSALPVLAVPITAAILVVWQEQLRSRADQRPVDARGQLYALLTIPVIFVVAGLAFFVTSPYAVLDWSNFIQATLIEQGRMVRGLADMPFTRQYRNTTPYLYFLEQQLAWGMWWPLGTVAGLGILYALWRLLYTGIRLLIGWISGRVGERVWQLRDEDAANIVMWAWVLPYFGLTGAFLAKFNRYMSPLLPFAVFFAAGLIWVLWRRATTTPGWLIGIKRALATLLAIAGVGGGLFWSAAYINGVYRPDHPWITASRWIAQNIPAGSTILCEQWDDCLPWNVPDEPEVNAANSALIRIDWGPYEEDTAEKYAIMKAKLREADYVIYSSKRIYDSVDELPERYPLTIRYYEAMFNGELGFELAQEFTSPPRLFGLVFDDRHADESWSLYDHAQATVFRKVRDLNDAEYDALFADSWATAVPWYRGADSPLSPLLNRLGLGNAPESEGQGLINRIIAMTTDQPLPQPPVDADRPTLRTAVPLDQLPVVDNYRWNQWASENTGLAILWWWVVVALLGWVAWPFAFWIFRPLRDRGYLLSRALGWLLGGWLLWVLASTGLAINSVMNSWLTVLALALFGAATAIWQWRDLKPFLRAYWGLLLASEMLFAAAYIGFVRLRMGNPDLWQLWFGGEKFMEFAMLNGILRSPTFPPVDPHFAGGIINYYYFGLYLVAYVIKLTGIYAEVAFNLAIPTLFALTVVNAFAVAYSAFATKPTANAQEEEVSDGAQPGNAPARRGAVAWHQGFMAALLAPILVTVIGNLDGIGQLIRNLANMSTTSFQSTLPGVESIVRAGSGLRQLIETGQTLPTYDFWGPSRVIPDTINEFPYWSFLFADLHPHLIGMPLALLFLGLVLTLFYDLELGIRIRPLRSVVLLLLFALLLGALASVNLWELPTYFGLGVLALLVAQYRRNGSIHWLWSGLFSIAYIGLAYLLFWPFFNNYVNVGASGVGFVKAGDALSLWLLIWGLMVFVLLSWLLYTATQRPVVISRSTSSRKASSEISSEPDNDAAVPIFAETATSNHSTDSTWPSEPASVAQPLAIAPIDATEAIAATAVGQAELVMDADQLVVKPVSKKERVLLAAGSERWLGGVTRYFDRLPRFYALHQQLVHQPTLGYLLTITLPLLTLVAAVGAWFWGRSVLALCLLPLGLAWLLLWRRSPTVDRGTAFTTLLTITGLAILAGTQVIYLRDFLQGGGAYRMNTLFKFFSQVWVIWGLAAAIALPRLWQGFVWGKRLSRPSQRLLRFGWSVIFLLLFIASFAFPIWGTGARLDMRFPGWRPEFGTLNGLEFMREGRFDWPDPSNTLDLQYDWAAIQWLLANVQGNATIVESSQVAYYREAGSRIASLTGLSGLNGMHEGEQRYGDVVGARDALHREFWETPDTGRMQQILSELNVDLVYVGPLERYLHPGGVQRVEQMAASGQLTSLFSTPGSAIYAVPGQLTQRTDGIYVPSKT